MNDAERQEFWERGRTEICRALRLRGYELATGIAGGPPALLEGLAEAERISFYAWMKRYSFRLCFRDLVLQGPERVQRGRRFYSPAKAGQYLAVLGRLFGSDGLERLQDRPVDNLGELLEWLVAEILAREFGIPSLRGVKIRNSELSGDLDLVALLEGGLLAVEVKSSPPKHIHLPEVQAFVRRLFTLGPRCAALIEDTHLRMQDKLVPLMEEALALELGSPAALRRLEGEIFTWGDCLALLNSKPDLAHNLAASFRVFLRQDSPFRSGNGGGDAARRPE
jgi:hypothetical protein